MTKRTFEDFIGDAIVDVAEDDDDDPNVLDADVIEDDDAPLVPRDPDSAHEGNRFDRAVFAEIERPRPLPKRALSQAERDRIHAEEHAALARVTPAEDDDRPSRRMTREQLLLAKEAGYNFSSRGEANRAAVEDDERTGKRRARVRDGGMGER